MCGITGFYTNVANVSRSELHVIGKNMTETLKHRGPDADGLWQDPDVPLLLGHTRLSIIDLSDNGAQPMASSSERYVITYNGEIYNYLDLQKDLEATGTKFRGRSDTEVILAAIEHWGLNQTLQKLNGMFAFALWDREERVLHFARDRLGKKPLYIGWAGQGKNSSLIFGSELKALHAHPDFKPEVNRDVLALYMRYGYVPAPHCIYKNVWSLPAGHRISLNTQNLEPNTQPPMEPYWHHLRALQEAKTRMATPSDDEVIENFEELLTSCIQDRLISDVPLGAFLSGGIDSSSVVALMQKISGQPIKTYTIGFEEEGFNEAIYAKKIAEHLGTDHHELYLTDQDALAAIPKLPNIYDEPFADISAVPTALISHFARQQVTVALSGDGGDEMLGGYTRHVEGPKIWRRMKLMPKAARKTLASMIEMITTERWDNMMNRQPQFGVGIHKAASILSLDTQDEIYQRLISQWDEPVALQAIAPETFLSNSNFQTDNLSFAEDMMYKDALSYLPNDILVKVDRASMAVGLEARAPLLDRRIYDYVWSLPEYLKIRGGKGKWLLRQVLARHVPTELFERPKQGFNMPVGDWLRGPLKDWAEDLLDERKLKSQGYLSSLFVREIWQEHLEGRGHHTGKLWTALMFQAWQDRWL